MMKFLFRPPLINIINIMEDKGYFVVSHKENGKYKAIIFYNDAIFKRGITLFNNNTDCLKATYIKLYDIYRK